MRRKLALHIIRHVNEGEIDQTRLAYSAIPSVLRSFVAGPNLIHETGAGLISAFSATIEPRVPPGGAGYCLCPGTICIDELITAWMLRAYSIAPATSMSSAVRA